MTTPEPQRRTQRRTHLDASVVPVERALLARAAVHDEAQKRAEDALLKAKDGDAVRFQTLALIAMALAQECRALAEELHYW